jgi:hypothetical protein
MSGVSPGAIAAKIYRIKSILACGSSRNRPLMKFDWKPSAAGRRGIRTRSQVASRTELGRVGAVIGISAGISMAWRSHRLMQTHPLLASALGIDAYRRILQREAKALTICWQTMLLVQLGVALNLPGESERNVWSGVTIVATIAPVVVVAILTRRKAQAYRRRSQELDRL